MQLIDYWNSLTNGDGGPNGTQFVDKNTGLGKRGTFPAAGWFNMVQNELGNLVTSTGKSLDGASSTQIEEAVKYWALYANSVTLLGSQSVSFSGIGTTTFSMDVESYSEVDGNYVDVSTAKTNDLTTVTDIFDATGTVISSITEIQDKHLYVILDASGNMKLMIIPDAEMEGASNVTANNPELIKDRYSASPSIWNSAKKGYYKTVNSVLYRIIGHIYVNGINEIDYYYELGNGYRYKDTQDINVGCKFIELRFQREHPACFVTDGSTITNMSTEYPKLFELLGTNVLPDWIDKVGRNIDLAGARSLRDTQEDAFQGFKMGINRYSGDDGTNPSGTKAYGLTNNGSDSLIFGFYQDGENGIPRVSNETRMKNFAESVQMSKG